ncbi:MAG: 30S ribosomal protein S27ae [Candidatus Aenigmarchaeota archaeon]|nr:30S ribosomal protein S27ae [Candidatus Aenigmarchaeota archaeon]
MGKEKKAKQKGKKQRTGRKHESIKIWQKYEISGDSVTRKNKFCPRCGEGTMLSNQKNRLYCGKCGYTSFGANQAAPPKPVEAPKIEEESPKTDEKPSEEKKEEEKPAEEKTSE